MRQHCFLGTYAHEVALTQNFRVRQLYSMRSYHNKEQQSSELLNYKRKQTPEKEKEVVFFIASCGFSHVIPQFSPLAPFISLVVAFSFCFSQDIVKGGSKLTWFFNIVTRQLFCAKYNR